jgi:hypothetical protein
MSEQDIRLALPHLKRSDYSLESKATSTYNCVSWAFSETTVKYDPAPIFGYYWPRRVSRSITALNYIAMFERVGHFTKCDNGELEPGFEKIAVYEELNGDFSHVARQRSKGTWTSKVGNLDDIDHPSPFVLEKDYGKITQFLKRPLDAKEQAS